MKIKNETKKKLCHKHVSCLNAMVAVVGDHDLVVGSNRQVARRLELPVAAASPTKPSHQPEVDVEDVNTVIGGVRHEHVTALCRRNAVRPRRKLVPGRRFNFTLGDHPTDQRLDDSHAPRSRTSSAITTSSFDVVVHRYRDVAFRRDGDTGQPDTEKIASTYSGVRS